MLKYENLVEKLGERVESILPCQIMDPSRDDYGGFFIDGVATPTSVNMVAPLGHAYLLKGGKYYQNEEILKRILAIATFGRKIRRESGCFDLITTNFDSSPDTGFLVMAIAPVVRAARQAKTYGDKGAEKIVEELGEIIQTAVPGMITGGFHTPNHRWVLVGALSQALELFPNLDGMGTIEKYLAETIDINTDGEYIERSAGVYNAICNRSLRLAADALGRPELLEPVRRNLDLSYHMLNADGTVVTSFSRRQDHGTRVVPGNMVDTYYYMARRDKNGFYAAVADWLYSTSPEAGWILEPFLTHSNWREDNLKRDRLPKSYSKVYPTSKLWRVRRNKTSATTGAGITTPFSIKHGQAELTSVNFCASYFSIAQFVGETFEEVNGQICMTHKSIDPDGRRPGYDMPLGREVAFDEFYNTRKERNLYKLPPLFTTLEVKEIEEGFNLHITSTGYNRVPFQIACDFVPGGEMDFGHGAIRGKANEILLLKGGSATYHVGNDAISIGPGAYGHRFWQMRGSESTPNTFRVLITFLTPVDHTLSIKYGTWSAANERIM